MLSLTQPRYLGADLGYSFDYVGELDLAKDSENIHAMHLALPMKIARHPVPSGRSICLSLRYSCSAMEIKRRRSMLSMRLEPSSRKRHRFSLRKLRWTKKFRAGCGMPPWSSFRSAVMISILIVLSRDLTKETSDVETKALLLLVLGATRREETFETLRNVASTRSPF